MIIYDDIIQGSDEWRNIRLGKPTASAFNRIVKPSTLTMSSQADKYIEQLVIESRTEYPCDTASSGFMERGKELEPDARATYAFENCVDVRQVGFVTNDAGTIGCSPDGLIGDDGGWECKCLSKANHEKCLAKGVNIMPYKMQVMGVIWICELKWCDLFMYHPTLPCITTRVDRDETVIVALQAAMVIFLDKLQAAKDKYVKPDVCASCGVNVRVCRCNRKGFDDETNCSI